LIRRVQAEIAQDQVRALIPKIRPFHGHPPLTHSAFSTLLSISDDRHRRNISVRRERDYGGFARIPAAAAYRSRGPLPPP
jgi:hypothetical protein